MAAFFPEMKTTMKKNVLNKVQHTFEPNWWGEEADFEEDNEMKSAVKTVGVVGSSITHRAFFFFILLDFIGKSAQNLFQWDETGGVSGTNTGSTVTDWLVSHGEFTNVVVDHFWLDFNLVEDFTVVDTNDGSNHLWYNDDITKMSLDHSWFFTNFTGHGFLGLSETLEEVLFSSLDTTVEMTTLSASEKFDQIFRFHIKKLIEIDTTEGVLLEGSLLLDLNTVRHCLRFFIRDLLDNRNRTQK